MSSVTGPPAVADLPRLAYTSMVSQEAMRLYLPIYLVLRRAVADDEIAGYRIRRGQHRPRPYVTTATPGSGTTRRASSRAVRARGGPPAPPDGLSPSRAAPGVASARATRCSSPGGGHGGPALLAQPAPGPPG